jgi:hydrogenase maturation protein HypF
MLPYTPLHYLLLNADGGRETGDPPAPIALVMTSGNLSDEPIAYRDEEAFDRLDGIADAFLTHDRVIHMRCDDSVARCTGSGTADAASPVQFLRRSRGYAPRPIALAWPFPKALLAVGPHLKNTFCLGKGRYACLGPHIGDLENLETLTSFREGIVHFQRLFDIEPEAVAYDLHPGYLATQYALESTIPEKIGVQHHHAHIASVMAEHGLEGPVIGVAADGTGYGTDGAVWGGEILVADLQGFERAAHLAYVPLPGGEQAIRQPWRMAAVYLQRAFGNGFLDLELPLLRRDGFAGRWRPLAQMIERGLNSPPTSSMGRLFDGVAALLGVREEVRYEGQAAIELETLARGAEPVLPVDLYPFAVNGDTLDPSPLIGAIVADLLRGAAVPAIARRFHESVAAMLAQACARVREERGLDRVVLSGGVFQNRLLLEQTLERLTAMKFQVYINRIVPPNDGGVSLGQAAVAAARLRLSTS